MKTVTEHQWGEKEKKVITYNQYSGHCSTFYFFFLAINAPGLSQICATPFPQGNTVPKAKPL